MGAESPDIMPTEEVCRALAAKNADLVDLSTQAVTAGAERLSGSVFWSSVEATLDLLEPRLISCVASLPADFAVMCRTQNTDLIPVLHVYRAASRRRTRDVAHALPRHPKTERVLRAALKTGCSSEDFTIRDEAGVVINTYRIRNLGVVAIGDGPCVCAFVNRRIGPVGDQDVFGFQAPWGTYTLQGLRRRLRVSPLQMRVSPLQTSHAAFERELPSLLSAHRGKWVVYWRAERLGIRNTVAEGEQIAIDRSIPEEETYVRLIEEQIPLSFGFRSLAWS